MYIYIYWLLVVVWSIDQCMIWWVHPFHWISTCHIVNQSFGPQTTNLNYQVYSPTSLPIVGDEIMSSQIMSSPQIIINWDEAEKVLELGQDQLLAGNEDFTKLIAWNDWNPTLRVQVNSRCCVCRTIPQHSRACHFSFRRQTPKDAQRKQTNKRWAGVLPIRLSRSFKTILKRIRKGIINKWLKFPCKKPFKEISLHAFGTWILMVPTTI